MASAFGELKQWYDFFFFLLTAETNRNSIIIMSGYFPFFLEVHHQIVSITLF